VIVRLGLIAGFRNGLSRMSGNHHVRFLGEDAVERPHPYPTQPGCGIHHDQGLEHFPRMDDGQRQRADRHHIDPDRAMFRIQPADEEVLTIRVIPT